MPESHESLENVLKSIHVSPRWVDKLFDAYELFPYLDTSERTVGILTKKSLGSKLADAVFRRANLTSLLKALSGIDLGQVVGSEGGLIGECYRVLDRHLDEKRTLIDRINNERRNLEERGLSFAGVQFEHSPVEADFAKDIRLRYLKPFLGKRVESDRQFIGISGHLCSVQAARSAGNLSLAKTIERSGSRWMITDFPSFLLDHPDFQEGVMLLEIGSDVLDALEQALPFSADVGWYPYVRIYGDVRATHSPDVGYPVLKYSSMEYRRPKHPARVQELISEAYNSDTWMVNEGFRVNKAQQVDLLLFLQVLRVMQKALRRPLSELPTGVLPLAQDAFTKLAPQFRAAIPAPDHL